MKKSLCLTLVLVMALSLIAMPASAAFNPRYVGTVYASNSTCSINNYPIKCYVMDGYMFVQVEDLNKYGFDVVWNSYDSTLRIMKDDNKPFGTDIKCNASYIPHSSKVGTKLFDMTTTYVRTFIGDYAYEIECLAGMPGCTYINVDNLGVFGDMSWNNDNERMYIWTSNPDNYSYSWVSKTSPDDVPKYEHDEALHLMTGYGDKHYYDFCKSYSALGDHLNFYFGQHSENYDELSSCVFCYGTFYVDIYDSWGTKVYTTSKYCGFDDYSDHPAYMLNLTEEPLTCEVSVPIYDINFTGASSYNAHLTFWCDYCNRAYETDINNL